jgi:alginate O-acetyltransferase complex protein AlgI
MITTPGAAAFLLGSAALFWLIPRGQARLVFLAVASMAWIGWQDRSAAIVTILLTLYSAAAGHWIVRGGRHAHVITVSGIIALLVVFKYLGLLTSTFDTLVSALGTPGQLRIDAIAIPLGLSYITFKHISYLTDIHWKVIKPGTLLELVVYSSLFTIFVAGPIERFSRLQPQLRTLQPMSAEMLESAFVRIVVGLFKKAVLADWIGYFAADLATLPGGGALTLLAFSLQIFFDFAGYSDIAIGASQLFGLTIMENFRSPYLAENISRFWQCWHISLSEWIRDYVFFPLSGLSRRKLWMNTGVPLVAMALCGLWHGASWHFMYWGLWHGMGIAVFQAWQRRKRKSPALAKLADRAWFRPVSILLTFTFVTVGWLWFR